MSRKGPAVKKRVTIDQKYKDKLVGQFINKLMWDGKKRTSEKILYSALDIISEKNEGKDELALFKQAVDNVKPLLEVRSRRVGGANYQVPVEVRAERKVSLAIRWILQSARSRGEKKMESRLASELMEALEGRGGAMKKREDVHRMAEANRAFAHYRW